MYVLIGNQGRTAIFKNEKNKNGLVLKKKFENKKFLKKESSLFSHRAGTGSTSYTSNQTTLGENQYKNELVSKHCKEITDYLEVLTKDEKQEPIILVCGPSFLGDFRKKMPPQLSSLVRNELSKNYFTEKPHELEAFLKNHDIDVSGKNI